MEGRFSQGGLPCEGGAHWEGSLTDKNETYNSPSLCERLRKLILAPEMVRSERSISPAAAKVSGEIKGLPRVFAGSSGFRVGSPVVFNEIRDIPSKSHVKDGSKHPSGARWFSYTRWELRRLAPVIAVQDGVCR